MPRKKKKRRLDFILSRITKWAVTVVLVFIFLSMIQVIILRWLNPPITVHMFWKWAVGEKPFSYYSLRDSWRPLNAISPHLRRAVVAGEDQRFMQHSGFDFQEMNKAIKDIARQRGFRGASTISMQAARTVFLWPKRSLSRKIAEAYYTKAININPARYGPIYKNRAVARMQNGNNAGAKDDLARYLQQTPGAADRKSIEEAIAQL